MNTPSLVVLGDGEGSPSLLDCSIDSGIAICSDDVYTQTTDPPNVDYLLYYRGPAALLEVKCFQYWIGYWVLYKMTTKNTERDSGERESV